MSIWTRLGDIVSRVSGTALSNALEVVRTVFAGDPELRRRVAFSVAMIALSAKMAKADGIVTQDEIRAFRQIFDVPQKETRNVARLYDIAKQDTAGFEAYAERLAAMCGSGHPNCAMLEDILDGLFHIAKADGVVHEREVNFLRRISEIFEIDADHFESILARHAELGETDPYKILGIGRDASFEEIRKHYRKLVRENHPDRAIARGLPEEFIAIASTRIAALNAAYETIERGRRRR
ncbi:MAG: TerB family tellurite resistance protein [Rhizobiaceae bacterium]|jgi:DnaJ like chaperone protein